MVLYTQLFFPLSLTYPECFECWKKATYNCNYQQQAYCHMEFFYVLVYFCGFIGCAAFALIPARSFKMIATSVRGGLFKTSRKILLVFAIFASVAAFLYEIRTLLRIYNCLIDMHCTLPGIRMWMYLTMLGTVYLAFEVIFFIIRKISTW